ncbi:MAG: branched-chain amino acid ABC transporter permease, partial [Pseudobdellovibrionaceae bacterium]
MQDFIQHLINGISLGSIYALIALGYTMVYGILQMINFAHADVYMVGAFTAYYAAKWLGLESSPGFSTLIILLLISMFACSLLGLAIERFAYRPLRKSPKLNVLITAIGVSLFLEYAGQVVFGADPKVFPEVMKDFVLSSFGGIDLKSSDVTVLGVSLVAMVLLNFIVQKTKLGRAMRAVSTNAPV